MGLLAKKKNDFEQKEDGKTFSLTDLFTFQTEDNNADMAPLGANADKEKDENLKENPVKMGQPEQRPKEKED